MRVRVLCFGVLRDRLGSQHDLTVPEASAASAVIAWAVAGAPELATLWPSVAVAVNQRYSNGSTLLQDGDEVALLPPVSGGYAGLVCT